MAMSEGRFKVTVECRSVEAAEDAAERLRGYTKNVSNVFVDVVGTVIHMIFDAISSFGLTILGSIKDLLGASYKPSIAPAM